MGTISLTDLAVLFQPMQLLLWLVSSSSAR